MATQTLKSNPAFNPDEFNMKFINEDNKEETNIINENKSTENINMPMNYMDDFGLDMKNLFFKILEILLIKENPIPYIMENEKRQFIFAIMILIIGVLLLFFSNLMIST